MSISRLILALTATLTLWASEQRPKGLPAGDWQQIRALHDRHQHGAVRQADGTIAARNPGQQWNLKFDGRGFTVKPDGDTWTWGLELERFGLAGQAHPAGQGQPVTQENRVSYQRTGVEEWFVNDGRGLEQGFTVPRKPAGNGDTLVFDMAVRGDLFARVADRSVSFTDGVGRGILNFGGLKAWDADGRPLAATFEKTSTGVRYRVEAAGAHYPVTVDPLAQQAYLKASDTDSGDTFGQSVAISGDTVVVGAGTEDSDATGVNGNQTNTGAPGSGAAYVFTRSGTTWTQQAYLKASNTDAFDNFGYSVAISGDTLVVTANSEDSNAAGVDGNQSDNSASNSGAAYVFTRSGTTWTQQAYLKASNPGGGDRFGSTVSISGDTVVVGAYGEDSNATGIDGNQSDNSASSSGAAYVFTRNGVTWTQQAYLKASNAEAADQFGWSVAISGDTVLVGANQEASNATGVNGNQADNSTSSGAAYVFTRSGITWTQQAYLKSSNTANSGNFGWSAAISGDTAVVGAYGEGGSAGAAYVFTRTGTLWAPQASLKGSNTEASDLFGQSVAIDGDTLVVGAYGEDSSATGINGNQSDNSAPLAGAAYVFTRTGGAWAQHAYLKASNTDPSDLFGGSVAISGTTVIVGARSESSNATGVNGNQASNVAPSSGAAYIFMILPGNLSISGGSPQSTVVNTAFGTQLQVTVRDSQDNPIPNVTVTFTPPISGASGTFAGGVNTAITNASGVATAPVFTANGTAGGPYNVTASIVGGANTVNFSLTNTLATVQITVSTNINGPQVTVNGGAPFTGTQTFTLNIGAPLTLGATTPQPFNGGQSQYVFQNWTPTNPTTVPAAPATYTANFVVQHQVIFSVLPAGAGTVLPASGFFDQGTVLNVQATPNPGFAFLGFTGALAGTVNPQPLTVTGPLAVTANFAPHDSYQIRYMSNLNLGDSVVNLTNTGARGAGMSAGTTASTTGAICANVYAFSPDEQMVSCCSCPVTPNGLVSLSGRSDLISNTLTPAVPTSLIVKVVATVPLANSCANSAATVSIANLAPGLLAWGTTIKPSLSGGNPDTVETPFLPASLSIGGTGGNIGELGRLQQLCNFINATGSGFGICRSCRLGGLGAGRI